MGAVSVIGKGVEGVWAAIEGEWSVIKGDGLEAMVERGRAVGDVSRWCI